MPFIPESLLDHDQRNPYGIVGTRAAGVTSVDEALEVGGLNWEAELHPVTSTVLTPEGVTTVEAPTKRQVVRINPDGSAQSLNAVVGAGYGVIQNRTALSIAQQVVDSSDATWGAVGATHGGARTFAQLFFPQEILIGGRDAVKLSLLVRNYHDGGGSLVGVPTGVRLACTNQFPSIERTAVRFNIQHRGDAAEVKIEELRRAIGLTFKAGAELQELGDALIKAPITSKEFLHFVDVIYPVQRDKDGQETVGSADRRAGVKKIYFEEEDQADLLGTRWGAAQAVIAFEDWHRRVRGNTIAAHAQRIVNHTADPIKTRATNLLLAGV